MTNQLSIKDLRATLKSVRIQIEMFEATAAPNERDKELRRRIKESKILEAVLLEKIGQLSAKP